MEMKRTMLLGFAASMAMIGLAKADPVPLSTYADANGFIDVQKLTCGQLANTYQEDANALSSWYTRKPHFGALAELCLKSCAPFGGT
jgi:hypothetical protein